MGEERYFLDSDHDGHWYLIPVSGKDAWYEWVNLDECDENVWDTPKFARPIDGSPSKITFTNPDEDF